MGASIYRLAERGDIDGVRSKVNRGVDVNKVDHYGNSALMSAGRWGREEVVLFLLAKGANINQQNNFGYTALMEAARFGQIDMVKVLVWKGAGITGFIQNDNKTAIDLCPTRAMESFLREAVHKQEQEKEREEEAKLLSATKPTEEKIDIIEPEVKDVVGTKE
jgi:ankyrin repeat protein